MRKEQKGVEGSSAVNLPLSNPQASSLLAFRPLMSLDNNWEALDK